MYYNENEARKLIIEAGRRLIGNRLAVSTWGNMSARTGDDSFIITPSGKDYDTLREEDLIAVRTDGSYEGWQKPSRESGIHADAYAHRDDIRFILHTHQYYASAVSAECEDTGFAPCSAYGLPGSGRLRSNVEECICSNPDRRTFLMARHGALILGSDPEEAFRMADELEDSCRDLVEAGAHCNDTVGSTDFDADRIRIKAMPFVKVVSDPYVMECCMSDISIKAYLDDFAQLIGPDIQVITGDENMAERVLLGYSPKPAMGLAGRMPMTGALDRMGGQQPALNSVIGRSAVLVRGVGAVCIGKTEADAEAAAMICSKNCAAACYVTHARPLNAFDSRFQRYLYLTKHS